MPSLHYRGKQYSCEYFDWYHQLLKGERLTRPNCVIRHGDIFFSQLKGFKNCSSVAALNISTSTFGNYAKTMQMSLDATIQLDKVMMVLPMDVYYPELLRYHASRKIMDHTEVFMLRPQGASSTTGPAIQTKFQFWHMHIDHVTLSSNKEIFLLLSPKSIMIDEYFYNFANQKQGVKKYELHFDTAEFTKGVLGG